jgi:hypothetical protein
MAIRQNLEGETYAPIYHDGNGPGRIWSSGGFRTSR